MIFNFRVSCQKKEDRNPALQKNYRIVKLLNINMYDGVHFSHYFIIINCVLIIGLRIWFILEL